MSGLGPEHGEPKIGVIFPQDEMPPSPKWVRKFAELVTEGAYEYIVAGCHDAGVVSRQAAPSGWDKTWPYPDDSARLPYSGLTEWHEVFVLFGFLSALLPDVGFLTNVVPAPQRQTVVLAKEAAEVDILSRGRLRLGLGVGWNEVEMLALDGPGSFAERGAVLDEQIAVLRALWRGEDVDRFNRFHRLAGIRISPLPPQRPVPIWIGSRLGKRAVSRVVDLADGWMPVAVPGEELRQALAEVRARVEQGGRDPRRLGLQAWILVGDGDADRIRRELDAWIGLGVSHVCFDARHAGLEPEALLDRLAWAQLLT